MALSFIPSSGDLPTSKGTIHTMSGAGFGRVKCTNTTGSPITINIYVNCNGTSRLISPKDKSIEPGAQYVTPVSTMENADLFEGAASATGVDYKVSGVQGL